MATEELLSTQAAAEYLSHQLPDKSVEQWALWLRNNRNQARRAVYRVKSEQLGRMAVYSPEDLTAFVEFEKSRQLGSIKLTGRAAEVMRAFGIGESGGSTLGRKLTVTGINLQIDEATRKAYVQLITNEPLMVFRLEPEESVALGGEFTETGKAGLRINSGRKEDK